MILAILAVLQAPPSASPERPVLRVTPLTGPIRIDGRLDEAAWQTRDSITGLTQVQPREGMPPTGRTVVRVLADADALVIGIRADDPEPDRITAFTRQRDADLDSEDHVRLVLDTFLDGRSGYLFTVGPLGPRYDALVTNQGEGENSNWDAAWEAAAIRTPTGWAAEIRLPVKSLIFRPGLTQWGFNVERRIQRLLETSRWSGPRRDWEFGQTSRAGLLDGLPRFSLGLGLTVRPALTTGGRHPEPEADLEGVFHPSLDVTQRVSANLLGSLTINTDFAETEVDTRRTNLTRFPLLFPEKREFFLEGSDIFDFGLGAADAVIPFFSRRIGLFEGEEIPLLAGTKLSGRAGQTNLGGLVTLTGSDDALGLEQEWLGAIRLRQNVLQESALGGILTFGDPGGGREAWTAGIDATFQTSRFRGDKNFLVGVWGLATSHDSLPGQRYSAGFKIDYPNDDWDVLMLYRYIDDGFQPSLGFVPRPAIQHFQTGATRTVRPRSGPFDALRFRVSPAVITDLDGRWESWSTDIEPVDLQLRSGDEVAFALEPQGERLIEPFEVSDGVLVPAGEYGFVRYTVELETASKRKWSGGIEASTGGFYSGSLQTIVVDLNWRPTPMLHLSLEGERNTGELPTGSFHEDLVAGRIRFGPSPDLDLVSFVQYDTESRSLGTNTRLRWTFHPLGDVFIVYNHNVDRVDDDWQFQTNELLIKVKYGIRY